MTAPQQGPVRVTLVTGAACGIGAATVLRLVADGVHIVALDWCVGGRGPAGDGCRT